MVYLRIDVITIFPEYFSVANLSLLGKAIERGLVQIKIHDLRDFGEGKHHSVDDIPYGGGPGMVMKAQPWGEAIDAVLATAGPNSQATLIFMNPAGKTFTQSTAASLSHTEWLIFACGRYEGIDARVAQFYRQRSNRSQVMAKTTDPVANALVQASTSLAEVIECSIGDYVVAGGESAALVVIEATTRLIPGVVGNENSVFDDSFANEADPLAVEAPSYTRPETWRGLVVPEVLRSGDHGAIKRWRGQMAQQGRLQRGIA